MLYIYNATIVTPDERMEASSVLIRNGRIVEINSESLAPAPQEAHSIDAGGNLLAPGFIDLQVNGAFGDDFASHPETIWRVAQRLPRYGITSFLPTIITCPLSQIRAAQSALAQRPARFRGAEPLGLHLEGPFLNPVKKGAHNPKYLIPPDPVTAGEWSPSSCVKLVTLAPELPGALDLIAQLTSRGVVVSVGHSMADLAEADRAYAAGARYATHLFNAMRPLDHQQPGLIGAILSNPEWTTGIIADGIHVHPTMVQATWLAKRGNLNLVSDAMAALGMPPGTFTLNDFEVTVSDRDARLLDGTLAGCILPLDQGVRNLIAFTGCTIPEALRTVTTIPAQLLGIGQERGSIRPGLVADLVLLDPELDVQMTIAAGELVYP